VLTAQVTDSVITREGGQAAFLIQGMCSTSKPALL
jgi:hypothetical protein